MTETELRLLTEVGVLDSLPEYLKRDAYRRFVESYEPADRNIISHLLFDDD